MRQQTLNITFIFCKKIPQLGKNCCQNTFKAFYQSLFFGFFCDKLYCLGLSVLNNHEQKLHNTILILSFLPCFLSLPRRCISSREPTMALETTQQPQGLARSSISLCHQQVLDSYRCRAKFQKEMISAKC